MTMAKKKKRKKAASTKSPRKKTVKKKAAKRAGAAATTATKGTPKLTPASVEKWMKAQQDAVNHWARHAANLGGLAARGDLHPGAWAKGIASMWQEFSVDLGKMVQVLYEGQE
jgi:hypothetical protein